MSISNFNNMIEDVYLIDVATAQQRFSGGNVAIDSF